MFDNYNDDCSRYSDYAEWLRLSDILNDWCKLDNTCKEVKKLAILGACENGEIEYSRSDGKSFDDPVIELQGRGLLLINKASFTNWKNEVEKINTTPPIQSSLLDFINNLDADYISVREAIEAIHKHIGLDQDINKAIQILKTVIGQTPIKPNLYKKCDFNGWQKVSIYPQYGKVMPQWFRHEPNVSESGKLNAINGAIQLEIDKINKELDDDLPF